MCMDRYSPVPLNLLLELLVTSCPHFTFLVGVCKTLCVHLSLFICLKLSRICSHSALSAQSAEPSGAVSLSATVHLPRRACTAAPRRRGRPAEFLSHGRWSTVRRAPAAAGRSWQLPPAAGTVRLSGIDGTDGTDSSSTTDGAGAAGARACRPATLDQRSRRICMILPI